MFVSSSIILVHSEKSDRFPLRIRFNSTDIYLPYCAIIMSKPCKINIPLRLHYTHVYAAFYCAWKL